MNYYKLRQLFYYKVRHGLLQIATGITKCDGFITNCDRYYKLRWLLQIATVQRKHEEFSVLQSCKVSAQTVKSSKSSLLLVGFDLLLARRVIGRVQIFFQCNGKYLSSEVSDKTKKLANKLINLKKSIVSCQERIKGTKKASPINILFHR